MDIRVKGKVKVEKVLPNGETVICVPEKANMILDNFFTRLTTTTGTYTDGLRYCYVGTGSIPASAEQTQLESQSGNPAPLTLVDYINLGTAPFYTDTILTFEFPVGQFNGEAIKEIGLGGDASSTTTYGLLTRVVLRDAVTILSDEVLKITYTLTLYSPTGDDTALKDGHTFITRTSKANDGAYWYIYAGTSSSFNMGLGTASLQKVYDSFVLGDVFQDPITGSSGTAGSVKTTIYPNQNTLEQAAEWATSVGNFAEGVKGFTWGTGSGPIRTYWQTSVTPPIMKTNLDKLLTTFSVTLVKE